ncbi:MAG: hypothetical protein ACM31K_02545 [Solirubrobacterales bacterium]
MRKKLRGGPALVIAVLALFVALGGGYAIGKGFIGTGDLKNQAVTNKKIKKSTIKGNRVAANTLTADQIDEASLSGAGTGLSVSQSTAAQVPATSPATTVLTLQVPKAGSYLFISKAVLAKGGTIGPVQCLLTAEGDSDRSLEYIDATHNDTIVNTVAHTFTAAGSVTLACDNPNATLLLVTDKRISAIPLGALSNSALP